MAQADAMANRANQLRIDNSAFYNPLSADTLADPFAIFRQLQEEPSVFWHDGLYAWVLSRYNHCRTVLQDASTFARDRRRLGRPMPAEGMTIQSLDPPDQIALRQAVLRSLRQTDVLAACQEACDDLDRCLLSKPLGQPFDFMAEAAAPAAMSFACRLVGVPKLTPEAYTSIFLRITRGMDSAVDPSRDGPGVDATRELNCIVEKARNWAAPGSMMNALYAVPAVADMPFAYVRNTISATFNAAYSTAYSSMGSFLVLALERPGLARRILDTDNVAAGVNELLRFTSPAQLTARYAVRDIVLGGVAIRQNDPIITLIAAANRDPEVFARPDELMLDRTPNPHLAFASGPHRCVGAHPAEALLTRFVKHLAYWESNLALAEPTSWLDTATLRCLKHLPTVRRGGGAPETIPS